MGIKGLFQFLKRFEKGVYIPDFLQGKSVAIDIFWFLYQSKGDMFYLQNSLLPILKNAKRVYCVFDGTASEEKREHLKQQAEKRKELQQSILEIEKFLKYPFNRITHEDRSYIQSYLYQLKRQAWQPTPEYIWQVKTWLEEKGCIIYQSEGEADDDLIELEKSGMCNVLITNDSDLLTLGSKMILRPTTPLKGTVFEKAHLCKNLGFTVQQWTDFMSLCRLMKENDVNVAYSLISVYKELDYVLQKYSTYYGDNLIVSN